MAMELTRKKQFIAALVILALLMVLGSGMYWSASNQNATGPDRADPQGTDQQFPQPTVQQSGKQYVFSSKEECESRTGKRCAYYSCDNVPSPPANCNEILPAGWWVVYSDVAFGSKQECEDTTGRPCEWFNVACEAAPCPDSGWMVAIP